MKETVLVMFGGKSTEYKVSCVSASHIIRNLSREKFDVYALGITENGEWRLTDASADEIEKDAWQTKSKKAILSPDTEDKGLLVFEKDKTERLCPDVIFPILHGKYGEDGSLQGLLELSGIPYVGTGVFTSSAMMDKHFAKCMFAHLGVLQADWVFFDADVSSPEETADEVEKRLGYPAFVKPCNLGSSIGINKVNNRKELYDALTYGAQFDTRIIIEEYIDAREVECAVLGNHDAAAAEVGEIVPLKEFYDFEAKYEDQATRLMIPADITEEARDYIRTTAVRVFRAVGGRGMSRVDFFIHKKTGKVYLNEINTAPGFTSISMYPKLWQAAGLSYEDLLTRLVELAKERV